MKPPTVFLGEMTDPEVEAFLPSTRRSSSRPGRPSSTVRTARC